MHTAHRKDAVKVMTSVSPVGMWRERGSPVVRPGRSTWERRPELLLDLDVLGEFLQEELTI